MVGTTKISTSGSVDISQVYWRVKQLIMTSRQDYEMKDGSVLDTAKHVDLAPENFDYSGATAKTDPKEIALVRKLDWWIMPILWLMYWLNYLVWHCFLDSSFEARADFRILGSQCHRSRPTEHARRRP